MLLMADAIISFFYRHHKYDSQLGDVHSDEPRLVHRLSHPPRPHVHLRRQHEKPFHVQSFRCCKTLAYEDSLCILSSPSIPSFQLYLFFSHLVATFAASFVLSLLIETPFVALETVFFQHIFKGGKEKRKYYYSVNPIPSLEGSEKKTKKPREGTSNGHASSPSVNGLREHLPLEEKFSGASVDSTSILVKTNGHGPTLIHRNDKPPLTSNTADADFDCRL